jgi:hypothetical protein
MLLSVTGLRDVKTAHDTAECPIYCVFLDLGDVFCRAFVADLNAGHILEMLDRFLHRFEVAIWKAALSDPQTSQISSWESLFRIQMA